MATTKVTRSAGKGSRTSGKKATAARKAPARKKPTRTQNEKKAFDASAKAVTELIKVTKGLMKKK